MAALTEGLPRRRRYTRQPAAGPFALTPQKVALLGRVADYGIVSLPQLAALVECTAKSARKHLRELFDGGLVEVIAVPRVALVAPARGLNDPSLLYGSAPNLYTVTRAGLQALRELGLTEETTSKNERYGPRNWLFLAHELMIRDVRVWFERAARRHGGHALESWRDGTATRIELGDPQSVRQLCPDAWLVYQFGERRLVAFLEVDRGTERNGQRWREKLLAYAELFEEGRLQEAIGYRKARVLGVAPDDRRRDQLAAFVADHAVPELAGRFWFADRSLLGTPDLGQIGWRRPGQTALVPLLPPEPKTAPTAAPGRAVR